MHDKLNEEITRVCLELAPPKDSIGLLSSDDVAAIVKKAATHGAMAGWVAGERVARSYWSREVEKLSERIKALEMEQIARAK